MKYSIEVPKPCNESWAEMTPAEHGRHCALCAKDVVDFTSWEPDAILQYLLQAPGRVCGRFTEDQLGVPVSRNEFVRSVVRSRMPWYRKIAAIFLFTFGVATAHAQDASVRTTGKTLVRPDTSRHTPTVLGGFSPAPRDTAKPVKPRPHPKKYPMGKPMLNGGAVARPIITDTAKAKRHVAGDVDVMGDVVRPQEPEVRGEVIGTAPAPVPR